MVKKLTAKAAIQIQCNPDVVFNAIVDPEQMKHYFIARGSGKMESGAQLIWFFPEFEGECPVSVKLVEPGGFISFVWDPDTIVQIRLDRQPDGSTVVTATEEGGKPENEAIDWLRGQTEGWANFLACLKAFVEYGINLRKGAFDFLKKK